MRAWDHVLGNNAPLSNNISRRRSPIKAAQRTQIEHSSTLDTYDELERGVRELLLPNVAPGISASNLFVIRWVVDLRKP